MMELIKVQANSPREVWIKNFVENGISLVSSNRYQFHQKKFYQHNRPAEKFVDYHSWTEKF
jgi:hypothetical protein